MILSDIDQSIVAALDDAPATTAPSFVGFYKGSNGGGNAHGTFADDSEQVIVPAPGSGQLVECDKIVIHNDDDDSIVVTLSLKIASSLYSLWVGSLAPGDTLTYGPGGFAVTDNGGRLKATQSVSLVLADGDDLTLGSSTGTKIGTGASQKLGFWNASPIVQPADADQAAVTPSTDFTGLGTVDASVVLSAVQAVETLVNALRAALVNTGLIKGSA